MTNYVFWWFLKPSHALLFLLAAGLLARGSRLGRGVLAGAAALLLLLAFTPLAPWLIAPLEDRFPGPPPSQSAPYGIIVLAGGEQPALHDSHGIPHFNDMGDRLTTFAILAERHPAARLVHSGRGAPVPPDRHTPNTTAAAFLDAVLEGREVVYEDRSADTWQAALEVYRMLSPAEREEDWWLVTSAFHMPRSVASFRAAGLDVIAWPTDYQRRGTGEFTMPDPLRNLRTVDWALHEWLGLVYYRVLRRTHTLFPPPRNTAPQRTGQRAAPAANGPVSQRGSA
jgi:uncharacterized SAM-binding protein YcdF (DUF218 family)